MTTKEQVAAIEKFPLWLNTKSELLLVIAGLKPAITIGVYGKQVPYRQQDAPKPSQARIRAIENLLTKIGLPYHTLPVFLHRWKEDNEQYYRTTICIGMDQASVDALAKVWTNITDLGYPAKTQDTDHGKLSGFPTSALKAFDEGGNALLSTKEMQKLTADLEYRNFCQMRFSRDHWQEELKTPEGWAKAVKKLSPSIYSKMIARR